MSERPLEDYSLPILWKRIEELQATIKAVKAEIESERANTKRVGIGNVIHNILDNIETALDSGGG